MHIFNRIPVSFIIVSSVLLTGCSGDAFEAFETPSPVAAVATGIADENSFTIGRIPGAVEGLSFNNVESEVTVHVADRHNHPVPDDTLIKFLTNGGSIQPSCTTLDGSCTVIWKSQNPRPGETTPGSTDVNPGTPGVAVILAYTEGEESFLDLNDNDAFDAGETIRDISEPYIDHNGSGTHDADEEFVDYDGNQIFDPADGVYTGASCVGDNTVCNHSRLFVWANAPIFMSGYASNFFYNPDPAIVNANETLPIAVGITDANGNPMAAETKVEFDASAGTVEPKTITVPNSGQNVFALTYKAPATGGTTELLTVTVTGPVSNSEILSTLPIVINAAP